MARILIVDEDRSTGSGMAGVLRSEGHDVLLARTGAEALGVAGDVGIDLVLCDLELSGLSGLDVLRAFREESPGTAVVMTSECGSIEEAVEAMQLGAQSYVRKRCVREELLEVVEKALSPIREGEGKGAGVRFEPLVGVRSSDSDGLDIAAACGIIGQSAVMRDTMELVAKVAETDSTVLITGETGTGKELFGRAIHQLSMRRDRIFCAVNSAAFPETLLESELFGHRRGAFTGASSNKKGLFEHGHLGTVFLDEVGEMPLSMQAKLLRFLQTGEIRPVGGEGTRYVDVRLVAATNRDLETAVSGGIFREDLYYRLAVIPVVVPPLRERIEDVPLLATHFLRRFGSRIGKSVERIDDSALDLLTSYNWPGNVRQLENTLERAVALCRGERITVEDLPARLRERSVVRSGETIHSLHVVERAHILDTLDKVGWNRKRAAELLQISTTTLWRRLKEFGIDSDPQRRAVKHFGGAQT